MTVRESFINFVKSVQEQSTGENDGGRNRLTIDTIDNSFSFGYGYFLPDKVLWERRKWDNHGNKYTREEFTEISVEEAADKFLEVTGLDSKSR